MLLARHFFIMSGRDSPNSAELSKAKMEATEAIVGGGEDEYELQERVRHAVPFDQQATKRLLRKMDLYLIPFLACLYLLSFLDRSNIGNARLAGLEAKLHINPKSLGYNVCGH